MKAFPLAEPKTSTFGKGPGPPRAIARGEADPRINENTGRRWDRHLRSLILLSHSSSQDRFEHKRSD